MGGLCVALLALTGCTKPPAPSGPRLNAIQDKVVQVGERLSFLVTVVPGSGTPPYEFLVNTDRPPTAQWVRVSETSARFAWTPELPDVTPDIPYDLEFTVQDASGEADSQSITVTVLPNGGPQFLNEPGYVLNLAESPSLQFLVRVKDDSVSRVHLELAEGPEGAYVRTSGNKEALFYWRPTAPQIALKRYWYVRVKAVGFAPGETPDSETEVFSLLHDISIVLVNGGGQGCSGTPPTLTHSPSGDWPASTSDFPAGIAFLVEAVDAESAIGDVRIYWSTQGAAGPFEMAPLLSDGQEGQFTTALVHPALVPDTLVTYFFEAIDTDDVWGSACDRQTRLPRAGFFVAAVTHDPPQACVDDPFEGNEPVLEPGVLAGLRLCPHDVDRYVLPEVQGSVSVAISTGSPDTPCVARLLDLDGKAVGPGVDSDGLLAATLSEASRLAVEVENWGDTPFGYWLTLNLAPDGCEAEPEEPNGEPAQAIALADGSLFRGTVCTGDSDFFRIDIPSQTSATLTLNAVAAVGDLDLYLWEANAISPRLLSATASDQEQLFYWSLTSQTLFAQVVGFEGAMNEYELSLALAPASQQCFDDLMAPNGTISQAVALVPSQWNHLVLCPGASDWFMLGLNGAERVELHALAPDANVGLILTRPDGTMLCAHPAQGPEATLSCLSDAPGPYTLQVLSDGNGAARYTLAWSVDVLGETCEADRFEPDSTPDSATPIDDWALSVLTLCRFDQDWFFLDLYPLQHLVIEAQTLGPGAFPLLTLVGPDGGEVLSVAETIPKGSLLEYDVEVQGRYFVRLEAEQSMTYSLLVYLE